MDISRSPLVFRLVDCKQVFGREEDAPMTIYSDDDEKDCACDPIPSACSTLDPCLPVLFVCLFAWPIFFIVRGCVTCVTDVIVQ